MLKVLDVLPGFASHFADDEIEGCRLPYAAGVERVRGNRACDWSNALF